MTPRQSPIGYPPSEVEFSLQPKFSDTHIMDILQMIVARLVSPTSRCEIAKDALRNKAIPFFLRCTHCGASVTH